MAKTKTAAQPTVDPRAAVIDEFLRLDELVKRFKPSKDRHDELRKQILAWAPATLAPEASQTFAGTMGSVSIGPRANERKVRNIAAVAKFFGARFYSLCSIPLKHLDSEMTEAQRAKYVTPLERTGERKLTAERT